MNTGKTTTKALFSLLTSVIVCAYAPNLFADTSGLMTLSTSGTHVLNQNHVGTVRLSGNNIVLDCNGHTIRDTSRAWCSGSTFCGIDVRGKSASVRNCSVVGHDIGISVRSTASNTWIYSNSINSNSSSGVDIMADAVVLIDNIIIANGEGVAIITAEQAVLLENLVAFNQNHGIEAGAADGSVLVGNDFVANGANNAWIFLTDNILVQNNLFHGEYVGITLTEDANLHLAGVNTFTISGNTLNRAGTYGLRIDGSRDGVVTGNSASNNGNSDCFENHLSSGISYSNNSFVVNNGCQ